MNIDIIKQIESDLSISVKQIEATLKLLSEGNTIPFIARYRKEVTNSLDEEQIRAISEVYNYQVNLFKRKEDVIRLIDEKGLMTEDLKNEILSSSKLVEVEDLYRPFKEKKKTKATEAIKQGLEPLAKLIMTFPNTLVSELAKPYLNDEVDSVEKAIEGAKYIIAENVSDNADFRKWIRMFTFNNGVLISKKKKNSEDQELVYQMYYEYQEAVKNVKLYRILAMNRGENENILSVKIDIDEAFILSYLKRKVITSLNSSVIEVVESAISDAYKRLIAPSVEREIRAELRDNAEIVAIDNFSNNLEKLLLQPPMKDKIVLGFDPAYRTGCKLAVIDHTGKELKIDVIYPHEPKNDYEGSKKKIIDLINNYNVDIIAIGNGTASRESETFIANIIKENGLKVEYIIVNEAGASVYSASKLAIEEFPDLSVEQRSAISIGRRLQDPLAELVKIDPESIGVGLYQHDVKEKNLKESLDFVVSKTVNQVGVNVNTASTSLFKYVSGMNKASIDKIINLRNKLGKILSREDLKRVISDKVYVQAIGFLRIVDGKNILDQTDIHPESYDVTLKLLNKFDIKLDIIGTSEIEEKLKNIDVLELSKELNVDKYTLEDIVKSLIKPNRDPRDDMPKPLLKSDVLTLEDLKIGMKLQGTVRNVVDFGAFIDIGLKNDGLAHISKLTNKFIKHPSEIVSVGDIVDCYVDEIFLDKKKVSLSLVEF